MALKHKEEEYTMETSNYVLLLNGAKRSTRAFKKKRPFIWGHGGIGKSILFHQIGESQWKSYCNRRSVYFGNLADIKGIPLCG